MWRYGHAVADIELQWRQARFSCHLRKNVNSADKRMWIGEERSERHVVAEWVALGGIARLPEIKGSVKERRWGEPLQHSFPQIMEECLVSRNHLGGLP